jgi:hypothetical protein
MSCYLGPVVAKHLLQRQLRLLLFIHAAPVFLFTHAQPWAIRDSKRCPLPLSLHTAVIAMLRRPPLTVKRRETAITVLHELRHLSHRTAGVSWGAVVSQARQDGEAEFERWAQQVARCPVAMV